MESDCYLWREWEDHTLWTMFLKSRNCFAEQLFVLNESRSYTYNDIFERAVTVARSMITLGIRPGDHVAFLLTNSPDYIAAMLAAASLGVVSVLGNPNLGRMELQHVIKQSDTSWVISDRILDDEILSHCPMVKKVIVTQENRLYQSENLMYFPEFTALPEQVSCEEWAIISKQNQNPEALAVIMYTSGSTAMPKGVTMTHDDLVRSVYSACLRRKIPVGHRAYVPVPLFHVFGYIEGLLCMMLAGGTVIVSELKFHTSQALHLMRYHKANEIICITNMMERILQKEEPNPSEYPCLQKAFMSPSHPHSGEAGVAFIDAVDETEETKARIQQYCEANLARFQIPKYMIYGDSRKWPKTASQKINRKELIKLVQSILKLQVE